MIATTDTVLVDFFEACFRLERLRGKNARYIDTYRRAIQWLEMAIGRDPTVADLTSANIRKAMRSVADAGNRSHWIEKMGNRLSSMWRYACRLGVATGYQRVSMIDLGGQYKWQEEPPEEDTVRWYYMKRYRAGLQKCAKQDTDAAVRAMDKMVKAYVRLDEVTDELLVAFAKWLKDHRKSQDRIMRYTASIRQVVRAWDPQRFPIRCYNASDPLPEAPSGSLRHFFEVRYIPERLLDAHDNTIDQAHRAMRRLFDHYDRDVMLSELDDSLVADHLGWLKRHRKMQATTLNGHRSYVLSVWRYANEVGLVTAWPRIRKLKELLHEPDSWELEEVRAMLQATSIFEGKAWRGSVPQDAFWRALLQVEYYTALRLGALLSLRRDDVDRDTRWIYVQPRNSKNRRGKKYRVGPDAIAAIEEIWDPKRELLFDWPYSMPSIWRKFRKIQKAAGLPESALSKSRFHKLRRTAATLAAVSSGLAAAIALLDHSGPDVTRRYIDPSKMPGVDATAFLPRLDEEL